MLLYMRLVSIRIRDQFRHALPTGEELCNDVHKRREHASQNHESRPITVLLTIYESPISDMKNTNDIRDSHVAGKPLLVSPTLEAVPVIFLPITLY